MGPEPWGLRDGQKPQAGGSLAGLGGSRPLCQALDSELSQQTERRAGGNPVPLRKTEAQVVPQVSRGWDPRAPGFVGRKGEGEVGRGMCGLDLWAGHASCLRIPGQREGAGLRAGALRSSLTL